MPEPGLGPTQENMEPDSSLIPPVVFVHGKLKPESRYNLFVMLVGAFIR